MYGFQRLSLKEQRYEFFGIQWCRVLWVVLLCCLWGRKDGFPGASGTNLTDSDLPGIPIYGPSGNTLAEGSTGLRYIPITTGGVLSGNTAKIYAIKNPLAFITNTATPYDWYTNSASYQDDALWGDGGEKSAYDPCPHGWRVPTDAEITFGDFSEETATLSGSNEVNVAKGRIYRNMAWYPFPGIIYNTASSRIQAGSYGYYWSTSIYTYSGKQLSVNVGGAQPDRCNQRAFGMSVRCVQE